MNQSRPLYNKYMGEVLHKTKLDSLCLKMDKLQKIKNRSFINIIEFTPEGYVTYVKTDFLSFLGLDREKIEGKHFSELIKNNDNKNVLNPTLWNKILSGEKKEKIITFFSASGLKKKYRCFFDAQLNNQGIPYKVYLKTGRW